MTESPQTEAQSVAALAVAVEANAGLASRDLAVVPRGYELRDLDAYNDAPRRAKASPTFHDVDSLVAYVNRFSGPDTVAFADVDALAIQTVLDYHAEAEHATGTVAASHADHTATLRLRPTPEWTAFKAADGTPMPQRRFAEFVETHLACVSAPAGAQVLEAVRSVEAVRNVEFSSTVDLDRGDHVFRYSSETKGKGAVVFPERVTLRLPPFQGAAPVEVQARTRFRIGDEGELSLWMDLLDADEALELAWEQVCARIEAGTGLDGRLFQGKL